MDLQQQKETTLLPNLTANSPKVTSLPKPEKPSEPPKVKKKTFLASAFEVIITLIGIFLVAKLLHATVFHPFYVVGASMEPTYQDGNYLFVDKVSYRFRDPARGDVIVFAPDWIDQNQFVLTKEKEYGLWFFPIKVKEDAKAIISYFLHLFVGKNILDYEQLGFRDYIKRIVAIPGETVEIKADKRVYIYNNDHPDGFALDEQYLDKQQTRGELKITLGKDEYFALGDNRDNSSDSRGGYDSAGKARTPHVVSRQSIEGRVALRLLPVTKISIIGTPDYHE